VGLCEGGANVLQVVARIRPYVSYLQSFQGRVPPRGVICTAPPRVVDGYEPGPLRVPVGQEIPVPGEEPGVDALQKSIRSEDLILTPPLGGFPDAKRPDGVYRRLAEAASVGRRGRSVGRGCSAGPMLRPREVALWWGLLVKDYVRHLACLPLVGEERLELSGRAVGVEMGEADGNKRGVPTPLVRIELRSGLGPSSHIVAAQYVVRLQGEFRRRLARSAVGETVPPSVMVASHTFLHLDQYLPKPGALVFHLASGTL
jgi:hypothetical protein